MLTIFILIEILFLCATRIEKTLKKPESYCQLKIETNERKTKNNICTQTT